MRHSRVYELIDKASAKEVRALAKRLAEEIEMFLPYGLKKFEPEQNGVVEVQFRPKQKVDKMIEDLRKLIPLVQQWYMPSHAIILAVNSDPRSTSQIAQLMINAYGSITYIHEQENIEKMVRLILSISGMVNEPAKITTNGHTGSERRWRLVKGVQANEHILWDEYRKRMGE